LGDLLDGLGQLGHRRRVAGPVPGAEHTGAGQFLAEVRQMEIAGEGAGDVLGPPLRPGRDHLLGRGTVAGDAQLAELPDVVEHRLTGVLAQNLAEDFAEEADVSPELLRYLEPRGGPGLTSGFGHVRPPYRRAHADAAQSAHWKLIVTGCSATSQ